MPEGAGQHLLLRRHHLVQLNQNPIWIFSKRTADCAFFGFAQDVRGGGEFHPFRLEILIHGIKSLEPEPDMRNADLINFDALARRQFSFWRVFQRKWASQSRGKRPLNP